MQEPRYVVLLVSSDHYVYWVRNNTCAQLQMCNNPDNKVHGAKMGPTWVLSAPDGPHVGPVNLAIREYQWYDDDWRACLIPWPVFIV